MSHAVRRPFSVIAILLLSLSTAWVSGCDDFTEPGSSAPVTQSTPAAPKGSEPPAPIGLLPLLDEQLKPVKDVTSLVVYDTTKPHSYLTKRSQLINAARGGSVSSGAFSVTIPPGALERDTYVTVRPSSLTQCQVEVLPSGLTFKPGSVVTLRFDYNNTDGMGVSSLAAVWYDPAGNVWVRLPDGTNDSQARKYSVPLSHFSYYALAK